MKIFSRYLLRCFLSTLIISLSFFVLIVQLVELFANLVQYLDLDVPLRAILHVQVLFLPQAVIYALPMALLFAVAFTLGSLYAHNELVAVFGGGLPLWKFTLPLIILGVALSAGLFFFTERVGIESLRRKNELSRELLHVTRTHSNTDITLRDPRGRYIYSAEYYNDRTKSLSRVTVVERDRQGKFQRRISATTGRWNGEHWIWEEGVLFSLQESESGEIIEAEPFETLSEPVFVQPPQSFRRITQDIDEMELRDAREWVITLRNAGQPFRKALTDYYSRYSYALTPLVVVLLSSSLGGKFRKNILLMSLLVSLVVTVVYYVSSMILGLMAGTGLISPLAGAWAGVGLFGLLGVLLFRFAKT
ncbi:lipopolysaccharide export system permease protein [Alkalispirochaeta americana]|uniref:Lipopolysaccharide export system permease protein n=1 Tax=Alkalispirochaeta americana TaxID=159291 RepID=A0A1N6P839_9SPIO|nr:LptF/LptG family permease [Alkalispirochaeta americana]SIQ00469.1 lipopolysaccharide export system permease protein [Alkalispirochaeta americana]